MNRDIVAVRDEGELGLLRLLVPDVEDLLRAGPEGDPEVDPENPFRLAPDRPTPARAGPDFHLADAAGPEEVPASFLGSHRHKRPVGSLLQLIRGLPHQVTGTGFPRRTANQEETDEDAEHPAIIPDAGESVFDGASARRRRSLATRDRLEPDEFWP